VNSNRQPKDLKHTKKASAEKRKRLAGQLRANLARRKAQALDRAQKLKASIERSD
jgi:hypothetical protein